MHGYGTFIWPNEALYIGQWINNGRSGFGKWHSGDKKTRYEGMWSNGKYDGEGKLKEGKKQWKVGIFRNGHYIPYKRKITDMELWE
jgi:hypothetical protein